MEDLQTITDIVDTAVKDSSYVTVLISSCVFVIYTLIIKLVELFKAKEKNKPLLEMASAIKEISENVVKLNRVLDKTIQDAEVKENERINDVVTAGFNSFRGSVMDQCVDIIIHNNITNNEESVKRTLDKKVNTEYYKLYSIFSAYERDSVNVSAKIKEEWIDDIVNECMRIIYKDIEPIDKIRQLANRLGMMSEEYSIFVKNKVFNH